MDALEETGFSPVELTLLREKIAPARAALRRNVRSFEQYPAPLLVAGEVYAGLWLEHNQDNIFLAELEPEAAWASQQVMIDHQREDGLLPFMVPLRSAPERANDPPFAYWHLQTVYPFARCALELAVRLDKSEEIFAQIYHAAARYDDWIVRHRNCRGTGLVEMYCEYDTGHDNSPRVTDGGLPHTCPGQNAARMPDLPLMPILAADLSATLYGGRVALAELARRLGRGAETARWTERAAELRERIHDKLYHAEDDFYYDRDSFGWRKYRSEHITRLFLNRVLEPRDFHRIFERYFTDEAGFWTPFPFPSISPSDSHCVTDYPKNSWGGTSQALTSLRALFWLADYGREAERRELLRRWLRAFLHPGNGFTQEIHPFTGAPIGQGTNYSPSLILFLEAARTWGIIRE